MTKELIINKVRKLETHDELRARITRLEKCLDETANTLTSYSLFTDAKKAEDILNETPKQSLAEIQADFANSLANDVNGRFNKWGLAQIWLNQLATDLRESAEVGE